MSDKKLTAAQIRNLSDEQIRKEQEKVDKARHDIREYGRRFKEEIDRRNLEGTIRYKIKTGRGFKPGEAQYLASLSKKEREALHASAMTSMDVMEEAVAKVKKTGKE
jgi:hypothetical protein